MYIQEIISSGEVFSSGKSLGTDFQLSEVVMGKSVKGFNGQVCIQEMEVEAVVSKGGCVSGKELEKETDFQLSEVVMGRSTMGCNGRLEKLGVKIVVSGERSVSGKELETKACRVVVGKVDESGKKLETKACGVVVGRVVKELEVHDSWFQEAIGPKHELETEDSEVGGGVEGLEGGVVMCGENAVSREYTHVRTYIYTRQHTHTHT